MEEKFHFFLWQGGAGMFWDNQNPSPAEDFFNSAVVFEVNLNKTKFSFLRSSFLKGKHPNLELFSSTFTAMHTRNQSKVKA